MHLKQFKTVRLNTILIILILLNWASWLKLEFKILFWIVDSICHFVYKSTIFQKSFVIWKCTFENFVQFKYLLREHEELFNSNGKKIEITYLIPLEYIYLHKLFEVSIYLNKKFILIKNHIIQKYLLVFK
jgi:hypothetical protein